MYRLLKSIRNSFFRSVVVFETRTRSKTPLQVTTKRNRFFLTALSWNFRPSGGFKHNNRPEKRVPGAFLQNSSLYQLFLVSNACSESLRARWTVSRTCQKVLNLVISMRLRSDLLPSRGSKHKKGPRKRVRTAFLTFPMSSQLFLSNISGSKSLRSTKCPPTKLWRLRFEWTAL